MGSEMCIRDSIENIPKFIFDDDTHKHDIGYYYELELKERMEDKVIDWLDVLTKYKTEEETENNLEHDFWKFVINKKKDQRGDPS